MKPLTSDELSRDLDADLAVIYAATAGPWEITHSLHGFPRIDGVANFINYDPHTRKHLPAEENAAFVITARTGWEIAIRRAKAAEAEVERLRSMVEGLAARVAAQSELLSRKAEDKP